MGSSRPQCGFSLVEIMISMTVFAIVFAGAFGALQMGYGMTRDARDRTRASQILQTELEAMRTFNWTDLSAMVGQTNEPFTPRGEFIEAYSDSFFCKRTVALRANGEQIDITLTVNWDAYPNQKEEVFYSTFTKNGINDYYYRSF